MSRAPRAFRAAMRAFMLLATGALAASYAPLLRAAVAQWPAVGASFVLLCLAYAFPVPFPVFRRGGAHEGEGEVSFDAAFYAVSFAAFGWFATALMSLASALAPLGGRRRDFRERLFGGAARFVFFAVTGLAWNAADAHAPQRGAAAFALFAAFNLTWLCAYALCFCRRRLWRDLTFWAALVLEVLWAYVAWRTYAAAGALFGLAVLLPVPALAAVLRALQRERLSSHRLSLARDAVWNLLQARDPGAQITSILESAHGDAPQETLQIYAALRSEDRPVPLASVGPWPGEDRMPLVRRALLELHAHSRESVTVRDEASVVTAFGVRADRLLGSLVVHRPAGVPARVAPKRYAAVAAELAPLLRDVRSVVAAHTAASLDSLTGLLNRAAIMRALREQLTGVRPGGGCAILLLDVDNFKSVNDRLGHLAGDQCLRLVAQTIAQNIRSGDRAGRIGGEEFIVLMPSAAAQIARTAGERVRCAIEACGARHADGAAVTASIGIAVAGVADTPETLIARADRALYQAKSAGRNRVVEISA